MGADRLQFSFTVSLFTVDTISIWYIMGKLQVKIVSAGNLNVSKDTSVSDNFLIYILCLSLSLSH